MKSRLLFSIAVLVTYMIIIMMGPKIQLGNENISLAQLTSQQIVYSLVIAVIFLLATIGLFGWLKDIRLGAPRSVGSLTVVWFPMLFIIAFFAGGVAFGLPPAKAFILVGINTLFVGIGEELAFRGVLFRGALDQFGVIGGIAVTCVIFGSVHALNGFMTGDFLAAGVQAVAAGLSGLMFLAIMIRTGSIIPSMILHWLWDFGIFTMTAKNAGQPVMPVEAPSLAATIVGPVLFALPNFLFALWLLRNVRKMAPEDV